ncbi:hypothetical protein V8C42DRAFT_5373 [Trichoderma barbatum]
MTVTIPCQAFFARGHPCLLLLHLSPILMYGACDRRSWQHYAARRRKLAAAKHSAAEQWCSAFGGLGLEGCSLCPRMPCGVFVEVEPAICCFLLNDPTGNLHRSLDGRYGRVLVIKVRILMCASKLRRGG